MDNKGEEHCLVFYARRRDEWRWYALNRTLITYTEAREWVKEARIVGRALEQCPPGIATLQIRLTNPGAGWSCDTHRVVDGQYFSDRGEHGVHIVASVTFSDCLPSQLKLDGFDLRVLHLH